MRLQGRCAYDVAPDKAVLWQTPRLPSPVGSDVNMQISGLEDS